MTRELDSRVRQLAERFALVQAADRLAAYADILATDPHAPTSARSEDQIVDDHLADSLVALELPAVRRATTLADLGSGAGLPGIPLAIALPRARVVLVESNRRKAEFLVRTIERCELGNVEVADVRAEEWPRAEDRPGGSERFELVTARALADLSVVMEYAAPLLAVGGSLVAWRGRRQAEVELESERAAAILGLRPDSVVRVRPYPTAEHRHLHVIAKLSETPSGYPRRPGIARRRPLGSAVSRPRRGAADES